MSTTVTSALISQYNLAEPAASLLALIPVDDVLASVQTDFDTHEDQRAQLFSLVFDYTADVSGDPESLSKLPRPEGRGIQHGLPF
jgi:hypothetical protein